MMDFQVGLSWSLGAWPLWLWMLRRVVRTTLVPAWCWAGVSLAGICGFFLALKLDGRWADSLTAQALYFILAVGTCCPLIAVYGAKRPQHRVWQWIVLSLWAILALPAGESLLFQRDLDIGTVRSWFLLILIVWGMLNYLFTRLALSSILMAVGQWLMLGSYLPLPVPPIPPFVANAPWLAVTLVSCLLFLLSGWLGRKSAGTSWNTVWRDFRDLYGAVWALRVLQRFNAMAEASAWPVRLQWSGFVSTKVSSQPTDGPLLVESVTNNLPPDAAREIHSLLRRFVATDWIGDRREKTTQRS
jgi:hypothetical protein